MMIANPVWASTAVSLVTVLFVSAESTDQPSLTVLPDHIIERMPWDSVSLRAMAQTSKGYHSLLAPTPIMTKLFEAAFPDSELPALIDSLAEDVAQRPFLRSYVTLQLGAGLFDRLMYSVNLSKDVKIGTLRVLITEINADLFLSLCLHHGEVLNDVSLQELFLKHKTPLREVPPALIGALPDGHFADALQKFCPPWAQQKLAWDREFLTQVRTRFVSPYDSIFPHQRQVSFQTCWLFCDPDRIGHVALVEYLVRCGLRLPQFPWVLYAQHYSPKLVPYLAPLFEYNHLYGLLDCMIQFVAQGQYAHAAAMLEIARVRQLLQSDPGPLIRAVNRSCASVNRLCVFVQLHPIVLDHTLKQLQGADTDALDAGHDPNGDDERPKFRQVLDEFGIVCEIRSLCARPSPDGGSEVTAA